MVYLEEISNPSKAHLALNKMKETSTSNDLVVQIAWNEMEGRTIYRVIYLSNYL